MHPRASAGLLWIAEESKAFDQLYWRDFVTAEGMLGLAIPVGQTADFLIQFAVAGTNSGNEDLSQYLTLGYRFSVWSKR
ncbi:MAG: hypothetical protein IPP40_09385 [bacterium]|nr:hypothetical protein [bacterium]